MSSPNINLDKFKGRHDNFVQALSELPKQRGDSRTWKTCQLNVSMEHNMIDLHLNESAGTHQLPRLQASRVCRNFTWTADESLITRVVLSSKQHPKIYDLPVRLFGTLRELFGLRATELPFDMSDATNLTIYATAPTSFQLSYEYSRLDNTTEDFLYDCITYHQHDTAPTANTSQIEEFFQVSTKLTEPIQVLIFEPVANSQLSGDLATAISAVISIDAQPIPATARLIQGNLIIKPEITIPSGAVAGGKVDVSVNGQTLINSSKFTSTQVRSVVSIFKNPMIVYLTDD